ncbi:MBL fold metallo-hydrolase [Bacillus sp. AGMB 02131]|uniref:MBL fold metallo-hydrolase n=1 Tax=Peribacillus faecalis TaxID=2772559 RepID=A0A927HBF0_9BACI|nr:MBL fold metallo-hydrolase [Peribacillus faecalis]MBD3107333.1 MBL fold metallo-hydrolase [Peribacillus faecalis]
MLKKITDHIHQLSIPIPYDLGAVNCYIVEGSNGYTIVDTGDHTEEAIAIWEAIFPNNKPIEKVVLTHSHTDHIGLAGWFQKKYNAEVWISKVGFKEIQEILSAFEGNVYSNPLTSLSLSNGGPPLDQNNTYYNYTSYLFEPNYLFEEGEQILIGDSCYESIWTPGHSPDHFSFYDSNNQVLFIGDHILQALNPIVMATNMKENPLELYLRSLEKLQSLSVQYVLPGHGDIIPNLTIRLEDMRLHYKKRWNQIILAVQEGKKTAFQISESIYGADQPADRKISGFLQTITNLIYLSSVKEITMEERDGVFYYYSILNT